MKKASFWIIGLMVAATACVAHVPAHDQQQVQHLCVDTQYAYETGYNRGMQRQHLDTSWVDAHCAPEFRQAVRESYLSGYNAGASNAPSVVAVPASSGPAVQTCRFSSDCGDDGYSCRAWRGDKVCMGYGAPGDPCWFGSDCLSGSCQRAGDAKTCR